MDMGLLIHIASQNSMANFTSLPMMEKMATNYGQPMVR